MSLLQALQVRVTQAESGLARARERKEQFERSDNLKCDPYELELAIQVGMARLDRAAQEVRNTFIVIDGGRP